MEDLVRFPPPVVFGLRMEQHLNESTVKVKVKMSTVKVKVEISTVKVKVKISAVKVKPPVVFGLRLE